MATTKPSPLSTSTSTSEAGELETKALDGSDLESKANEADPAPAPAAAPAEPAAASDTVQVKLAHHWAFDGKTYNPGDVAEVRPAVAADLVRAAYAARVD